MGQFDNKTVVITGGTSGIGLATAELFATAGAIVVIAGRDADRGNAAAAATLGDVTFVATDVADDAQVAALADRASERTGHIDVWFNNAGCEGPIGSIDRWNDETLRELLDTNVKGVLSGLHYAASKLSQPGGVLINTASFIGTTIPVPVAVAYGATKAAVISATQSAALALETKGIRVYAVCPWITDTPILERFIGSTSLADKEKFAAGLNPSGHLAQPRDIASAVFDLAAGTADVANGGAVLVDANSARSLV